MAIAETAPSSSARPPASPVHVTAPKAKAKVKVTMQAQASEQAKPEQPTADPIPRVKRLIAERQFEEAIALVSQRLIVQPGDQHALFLLSHAQMQLGKLNDAVDMAVQIDPRDPRFGLASRAQAAAWLSKAGEPLEARRLYQEALQHYPSDKLLLHTVAKFYNSVG